MSDSNDEMIYNWSNALRSTNSGEKLVAERTASDFKSKGYSASEALDVMIGDDYNVKIAENAVDVVYNSTPETPQEEVVDVTASAVQAFRSPKIIAASKRVGKINVAVSPNTYSDMIPVVENALFRLSTAAFVDKLTTGEDPIIPSNEKTRASWYRLSEMAKENDRAMQTLHAELEPFLSNALYDSVLVAENPKSNLKIASHKDNEYLVSTGSGRRATVNLKSGTCTCAVYRERNFEEFGVPCAHIVHVADTVSPYDRLTKSLSK